VGIALALNLKVSPPDAPPSPRAREEAGFLPSRKAIDNDIEKIGQILKTQYSNWLPKNLGRGKGVPVKTCLDPSTDQIKSFCLQLRSNAGEKRVVFHYNGHGVPKPTTNGEIWVFNREYTQYIPLSLYDLQSWLRSPTLFIFDCSYGGLILEWLEKFSQQRADEYNRAKRSDSLGVSDCPDQPILAGNYFALAPCGSNEILPSNPALPADLFTACLTLPIQTALRWAVDRSLIQRQGGIFSQQKIDYHHLIKHIPGKSDDRASPLGELVGIFTAITETIAWESFPSNIFQPLYREDPVVAAMYRNFLLADRIMRNTQCTPCSYPKLCRTHFHPLWSVWDQVVDVFLEQLPRIHTNPECYETSDFFDSQLTAFEVWLEFAGRRTPHRPQQLPIVLQAILSPNYRNKALELFTRFLDIGVWAVNEALSVGIYHYVMRLLQRSSPKIISHLIFIWSKIIAVDHSLQVDLVKAEGHLFFIKSLQNTQLPDQDRIRSAFILAIIMDDFPQGQVCCFNAKLVPICISLLTHQNSILRRWALICLGKLCENNPEIKQSMIRSDAIHTLISNRITDPVPEIRASAIYALGTFIATGTPSENLELNLALSLKIATSDINPIVRREILSTICWTIAAYERQFQKVALASAKQEVFQLNEQERADCRMILSSSFGRIWRLLCTMQYDPIPTIGSAANRVIVCIHSLAASELLVDSSPSNGDSEALHGFLLQVANFQQRKPLNLLKKNKMLM